MIVHTLVSVVLWHCMLQPSCKTVYHQEDVPSAHTPQSQLSAQVPSSTASAGVTHPGEPLATSGSQRRPAGTRSASQTQRSWTVSPHSDQQLASQPLPPSGTVQPPPTRKQRLICSVEVPGIGRAARVNHIEYDASLRLHTENIYRPLLWSR